MISLTPVYWLLGAYFGLLAWRGLRDTGNPRRMPAPAAGPSTGHGHWREEA